MNKPFKKSEVFTISIAHLAHDTFSSFLAPLLPLLIEKLGMSLTMSAFLDILRRIPALFNPFLGLLAEKTGIKYFVIFTPAITAICMGLVGVVSSLPVLFILLFVSGISAAMFHVPAPVMIKEVSGARVGTGMSCFMVGGELARTVGPLLVIAAVSWWGLEGIYKLIPLGLLASFALYIKLRNFEVHQSVRKTIEKGDSKKLLRRYWKFLTVIAAFILFQSAMKSALTLYLPVYLTKQGASLWFAGISLSILQFFGVIGTFFAGNISDRIGRRATLVISSIGAVTTMGLFIVTHNIILLAVLGLFLFASGPVLMASIQDTDSHMPAFMNSMYMFINFGVGAIIVFGVGFLGDWIGLEKTYIICAIFSCATIPTAMLLNRFNKQQLLP
ncbi:MAG: MFS transporter [Desulfobacteraceae bacterium 4572_35.1]|nr:MAG: MFS transporter [Desulfobacteraceae bacterium 4572_35.1]